VDLVMGQVYYDLGQYPQAMEHFQQMLTALQGVPLEQSFGDLDDAHVWIMQCLRELGRFADGAAYGDKALQIAEAVDRPLYHLRVYSRVGYHRVRQGILPQAIPILERAVALSQDANIPTFFRISAPYLALAYAQAGRATDALAVLEQIKGNAVV